MMAIQDDGGRRDRLGAYVRSTRLVLAAQVLASVIAAAATGYMLLQLRPLVAERARLSEEVATSQTALAEAEATRDRVERETAALRESLAQAVAERDQAAGDLADVAARLGEAEAELENARDALDRLSRQEGELRIRVLTQRRRTRAAQLATRNVLDEAIRSAVGADYRAAIEKYDEVLSVDANPYVIQLKSYAQFKLGDPEAAIETIREALTIDRTHLWAYFDLMRYQCAAGRPEAALDTLTRATEDAATGAVDPLAQEYRRSDLLTGPTGLRFFLEGDTDRDGVAGEGDGELRRLCRPILPELERRLDAALGR